MRLGGRRGRLLRCLPCRLPGRLLRLRAAFGEAHQAGLAVVEPPALRLGGEDELFQDEQPGDVVARVRSPVEGAGPEAGVVLHRLERVAALRLDDGPDVDAGCAHGHGQLDGQLVPRGLGTVDGPGVPLAELRAAGLGDRVQLLLGVPAALGNDQPVALQAPERRVDLPDVQRPGGAGA